MNHTPKYLEKLLPFTYDPKNLTIWGYASTEEEAEIANNVDPDLGPFIVTACNAHEDLVKALRDMVVYEGMDYNDDRRLKAVERAKDLLARITQ